RRRRLWRGKGFRATKRSARKFWSWASPRPEPGVHARGRSVGRLDGDEVADLADHAADRDRILEDHRAVGATKAEAFEGPALGFGAADAALDLGNFQLDRHDT